MANIGIGTTTCSGRRLRHLGLPVSFVECRGEDTGRSKKGPLDKVLFHEKLHPHQYLQRLLEGECSRREERALERRIRAARLPAAQNLGQCSWWLAPARTRAHGP